MSTTDSYAVVADGSVTRVIDDAAQDMVAMSAYRPQLNSEAFGQICGFLHAHVSQTVDSLQDALSYLADHVTDTAYLARHGESAYVAADTASADLFAKVVTS